MKREAAIVRRAGRDMVAVIGGGQGARLETELDAVAGMFPGIIVSAGIAGALDPTLKPGDVVISGDAAQVERLRGLLPSARVGRVAGVDRPADSAEAKRALAVEHRAIAVDMESHIAARVAQRRALPFVAIRAIADTADETLPPAALVGMAPDGGMALGAVLWSLAKQPGQLPALIATGRHAEAGFRALSTAFDALIAAGFDRLDPSGTELV